MTDLEYNKKCNKYFNTKLVNTYNIYFYSNNKLNFIILKSKNKNDDINDIWITYNICCIYDIQNNFVLKGSDIIIIEKNIIDDKIIINETQIKNINDLEKQIHEQILNIGYIGYIKSNVRNNIVYYYLVKDIIKE